MYIDCHVYFSIDNFHDYKELRLAVNKPQIRQIHIFWMEDLITTLNQEIKVDCLLIAVLMTPNSYSICKQTFLFVYGQPQLPIIVVIANW